MHAPTLAKVAVKQREFTYAAVVLGTLALVFIAPYYFPPTRRLVSPSYVFGFNNRVAIVSLAAGSIAMAALKAAKQTPAGSPVDKSKDVSLHISRGLVLAYLSVAACYLLLTAAIYFLIARPPGYYKLDWESSHFLWRLRLMDIYGLRPYSDFYVEYGPAFVYLPYWFHHTLQPFGISHEASYYILHSLLNLIGLFGLLILVAVWTIPIRFKIVAFSLLGLSAFTPQMGLNGLAIRYLAPYLALLGLHFAARGAITLPRSFWLAAVAAGGCLVSASISPEIGVACLTGAVVYGLLTAFRDTAAGTAILVGLLLFGFLLGWLLPEGYFHSFDSFSQGANNFAIVPAPHILFYVASILIVVPGLLAGRAFKRDARTSFECALAILSTAFIPGALGRCDPLHVLSYGLGLFVIAFVFAARSGRRQFVICAATYATVFIAGLRLSDAHVYGIERSWLRSVASGAYHLARGDARFVDSNSDLYSGLARYSALGLPFGSYGCDRTIQHYLWSTKKLVPQKYMGVVGVYTQAHLAECLADLSRIPRILIEKGFLKLYENRDTCTEQQNYLKSSFLFPAAPQCLHPMFDPNIELSRFIDRHYRVIEKIDDYYILERVP
jgi:hypothetical protein